MHHTTGWNKNGSDPEVSIWQTIAPWADALTQSYILHYHRATSCTTTELHLALPQSYILLYHRATSCSPSAKQRHCNMNPVYSILEPWSKIICRMTWLFMLIYCYGWLDLCVFYSTHYWRVKMCTYIRYVDDCTERRIEHNNILKLIVHSLYPERMSQFLHSSRTPNFSGWMQPIHILLRYQIYL